MTKRIYIVRHGETNSNKHDIVQGLHDELSTEGHHQAAKVAQRLQNLDFDAFFTSDATRTVETATAIATATKKTFTATPLFREVARPASLVGKTRFTDDYIEFLKAEYAHMDDPTWQVEDGEHFMASRDRALQALEFLEAQPEAALLVVSHGHFMRYMIGTILSQKNLTSDLWRPLSQTLFATNTGITMCEYTDEGKWRVVCWNDHAHFAE